MDYYSVSIILATIFAPIFAVQASQYIDRKRKVYEERFKIFKTLMATRGDILDKTHIEALNIIEIIFKDKSKKSKKVIECWRYYFDFLNDGNNFIKLESENERRLILGKLLVAMSEFLNVSIDEERINNQCYSPKFYHDIKNENIQIRQALLQILSGKQIVPIWITNPTNQNDSGSTEPREE